MNIVAGSATKLTKEVIISLANYRYKVFVEQLGWNLGTSEGLELDQFDRLDTLYVIARNQQGDIIGCARLLPTTQPYLLEEVFPELLNGLSPPKSDEIWELSRFAAMDFSPIKAHPLRLVNSSTNNGKISSTVTLNILATVMQTAKEQGAKRLLLVSYTGAERIVRRAGYHVHRAGAPKLENGKWIIACWVEIPD